MNLRMIVVGAVFAGALGFLAGRASTDEGAKDEGAKSPEMEAWEKLAQPGPEHKRLAALAGDWTLDGKFWFTPGPPTEGKSNVKMVSIMGGRFLREYVTGEMSGMSFEGLGFQGFDNATGKYTGMWLDSMGTGIMRTTGTYDEATKTFAYEGVMAGPGGSEMRTRSTTKIVSERELLSEMYMTGAEGETKVMELKYTRKSAKAPGSR